MNNMPAITKDRIRYTVPARDVSQMDIDQAMGNTKIKKQSQLGEVFKRLRKNHAAMLGLAIFAVFCLIALCAPLIAPYDYESLDVTNAFAGCSLEHPFGTDQYGRDIFSRLVYGAKYSLGLGLLAQLFGLVFGVILGCLAGYYGGAVDNIIMRLMDIIQAIPNILLSIVISTALGGGFINTVFAMGLGGISGSCRTIRGQFLSVREREFVEAAKAIDCTQSKIIFGHILPNTISPLIVATSMGIGNTIMGAAGLSYLGLGIQPPIPEWGAMLTAAKSYMTTQPQLMLWPGLCIAIVVLALNMFGDGLRDALDPKLKN